MASRLRKIRCKGILVTILLLPLPVGAADFNIRVPVDLSKMVTEINAVRVKCWAVCLLPPVSASVYTVIPPLIQQKMETIAQNLYLAWDVDPGNKPLPLDNAKVVGSGQQVTASGYLPDNVTYYACGLHLVDTSGNVYSNFDLALDPLPDSNALDYFAGSNGEPYTFGLFNNPAANPEAQNCEAQ